MPTWVSLLWLSVVAIAALYILTKRSPELSEEQIAIRAKGIAAYVILTSPDQSSDQELFLKIREQVVVQLLLHGDAAARVAAAALFTIRSGQ